MVIVCLGNDVRVKVDRLVLVTLLRRRRMNRRFLVTLVRHGETVENRQKIMQGQLNTKLSDVGNKQAQLLAMRLQNNTFTHMFSSDLDRASATARAIAEANKSSTVGLILEKRLRERGFGNLEGKPLLEYKLAAEKAQVSMQNYTPPGGETVEQVTARARHFFEELCKLMAGPLLNADVSPRVLLDTSRNHVNSDRQQPVTRAMQDWMQEADTRDASPPQPLHIDIPPCLELPKPVAVFSGNHGKTVGSSEESVPEACYPNSKTPKCQGSSESVGEASILIVSHGLLLRELKRLILSCYCGKLEGGHAKEAGQISPNTGLSQFGMSVSVEGNSVKVTCHQVYMIDDTQHLVTASSEDLMSHAKFQGAL